MVTAHTFSALAEARETIAADLHDEALVARVKACTTWLELVALIKCEAAHVGYWWGSIPEQYRAPRA